MSRILCMCVCINVCCWFRYQGLISNMDLRGTKNLHPHLSYGTIFAKYIWTQGNAITMEIKQHKWSYDKTPSANSRGAPYTSSDDILKGRLRTNRILKKERRSIACTEMWKTHMQLHSTCWLQEASADYELALQLLPFVKTFPVVSSSLESSVFELRFCTVFFNQRICSDAIATLLTQLLVNFTVWTSVDIPLASETQ
jgi:hypothetical protein